MKLNKMLFLISASALFLTACGEDGALENGTTQVDVTHGTFEDGSYELVEANYDENGWKAEFSIDVEDGEIVHSDYNEYNEQGTPKTEDDSYQQAMAEQTGVGPQEYVEQLNTQLVETQDAGQVDTVSGATTSSDKFQEYAAMLLNAAENGSTETIEVDN
ncbi:MAG: FMN-binding protein [Alkalibacterium sp.]|nr:FMN-binding protein [Alkalibacterium sp.]